MSGVGLNLRVSYKLCQGGRKYMEDVYSVHFVESADGDTELVFIGVFDGHGGREAAEFAKKHLVQEIINQDIFWSSDDTQVLEAIKIGFMRTHELMWKEVDKWPRNGSGKRSTAGTTCSIGIIRNSKLYVGHVGDSAIVLGTQEHDNKPFRSRQLTIDHKPESPEEKTRIEAMGGKVVEGKTGVQRVVWNRPIAGHKGPVRRSTQLEEVPFLAVARSLGDLWSYNFANGEFAVSPVPDVSVHHLDPALHKCLIFGSDGLWNVMSPNEAVTIVQNVEEKIEDRILNDPTVGVNYWINPSARVVDTAILRWQSRNLRADNTTAVVVLLDPYGPRKSERLLAQRKINMKLLKEKGKKVAEIVESRRKSSTSAPTITAGIKKASEQPGVSCTIKRDIPSPLQNTPTVGINTNNNSTPSTPKPVSLTRQSCIHPKLSPNRPSPELASPSIVADKDGLTTSSPVCANTSNSSDCGRSLRASNGSKSNLSLNSKVIHNQIKFAETPPSKSCQLLRPRTSEEPENDDQAVDATGMLTRKSERLSSSATKRTRTSRMNSHKNKLRTPNNSSSGGHMRLRPRSAEKNENQNSGLPRKRTRSSCNTSINRFTALKRKHGDDIPETRQKRTRVV